MNISVSYGAPNEAYQIPKILSINLDGFVKSHQSYFISLSSLPVPSIFFIPGPGGSLHMIGAG
jgi:hypothetical protein